MTRRRSRAALPASPAAERALRRLRNTIGEGGGSAQVLRAEAVEGEPALVAAYNAAREHEYGEIIARCLAGNTEMPPTVPARNGEGWWDMGEADARRWPRPAPNRVRFDLDPVPVQA